MVKFRDVNSSCEFHPMNNLNVLRMKPFIIFFGLLLAILACSGPRNTPQIKANNETEAEDDSLQYDLETFDARFDTWYALNNNPSQYRSQEYYENWNRQYVVSWNIKATQPGNRFFETIVGYEPTVDYGFELNHKLFYYFLYVERVLNIQIMAGGPQGYPF